MWKKDELSNKYVGTFGQLLGGGNNADSIFISYIKMNPRWLQIFNVKNKDLRRKKRNI